MIGLWVVSYFFELFGIFKCYKTKINNCLYPNGRQFKQNQGETFPSPQIYSSEQKRLNGKCYSEYRLTKLEVCINVLCIPGPVPT